MTPIVQFELKIDLNSCGTNVTIPNLKYRAGKDGAGSVNGELGAIFIRLIKEYN
jgi:hypothetical protein